VAINWAGEITEKLVTEAWQGLLDKGCKLKTESGDVLRVIYPGKTSDAPGSDFQDAVIHINRRTLKGNIELHVNASDWHKHEHDRNPAYNGVVLHVAWRRDCPEAIVLQNGTIIPSISLDTYLQNDTTRALGGKVSCSGIALNSPEKLIQIIDAAGTARFHEKAGHFQRQLQHQETGQSLYQGIMTALGYARNQAPFQELATKIPLAELESALSGENEYESSQPGIESLLLGTAGLLPSQRPECEYSPFEDYDYVNKLEKVWETMHRTDVMDYRAWQFFRVRPANSPLRRIAGMSRLLQRYRENGLLQGLVASVREAPPENSSRFLEDGLMTEDDGYWAGRFDFGKGYPGLSKWLIGQTRAADIVINILLPFVYGRGEESGETALAEKALALFDAYPPAETNTVARHMQAQFGLRSSQVKFAKHQQGLLHLYKKWCTQGRCGECALNGKYKFQEPNCKLQTIIK
jgi:hypothetical protein